MTRIALLLLLALALPLSACTDDPSVDNPDAGDDADTNDARDGDEEVIDPDGGDDTDTDVEPAPWNPDPLAGRAEDFTSRTGNYQGPYYNCEREDGVTQRFRCGSGAGWSWNEPLVDCSTSMPSHIFSEDYTDYDIRGIDCAEFGMVCVQGLLPDSDGCATLEDVETMNDFTERATLRAGEAEREVINALATVNGSPSVSVLCQPGFSPFVVSAYLTGCLQQGCDPESTNEGPNYSLASAVIFSEELAASRYLHFTCE